MEEAAIGLEAATLEAATARLISGGLEGRAGAAEAGLEACLAGRPRGAEDFEACGGERSEESSLAAAAPAASASFAAASMATIDFAQA